MTPQQKLEQASGRQPRMLECWRYPATVAILPDGRGGVAVATARPAMRAHETCGEFVTRTEGATLGN